MKRRVCMAGLLGLAVALVGLTINADEPAKSCSDKSASATACASSGCDAAKSACADQKSCGSETAIKQVSLTKEEAKTSCCGSEKSACADQKGCGSETAIKQVSLTKEAAAKSCCGSEKTACADQKSCGSETVIKQVSLTKEEADKAKKKPKVLCPVSGKPIKKAVTIAYLGGKVSVCCNGCKSKFEKDTAKYAAKANYQLVVTGQAKQKACPLSGGKLNPETLAKVGDVKLCYCCGGCKGKVAKAKPEEQIQLVFSQAAFEKGFAIKKKEAK